MRRSRTAVVLGAGLAGLSAAMEFAKSGCFSRIVVLEKSNEVGGNVRSRKVRVRNSGLGVHQDRRVDFGALQVWEWYASFLETAKEMGLESLFVPIERPPVLLENRELMRLRACAFQPFQPSSLLGFSDLSRLTDLPDAAFNPYEPMSAETQDRWLKPTTSLADLFPPGENKGGQLATYYESYTYGSTVEAPAYLWLPMVVRSGKELNADGRTQFLPWKMQQVLQDNYGCRFVFGASVKRVDSDSRTVKYEFEGETETLVYDVLVNAAPLGNVAFSHLPELESFQTNAVQVTSPRPEYRYTSYAAACVRMDRVPRPKDWSACFAVPTDEEPLQIRSWVNLHEVGKVTDRVLFYVHGRTPEDLLRLDEKRVEELVRGLCFFRGCAPVSVDRIERFPNTMPVFNASFLEKMERIQGRGDVWFAGHYLASFPSMELAVFTGKKAALRALESRRCALSGRNVDSLLQGVNGTNAKEVGNFKHKTKRAEIAVMGTLGLLVGAALGALAAALVTFQRSNRVKNK
jgi:protoporphyrinogen oxidase